MKSHLFFPFMMVLLFAGGLWAQDLTPTNIVSFSSRAQGVNMGIYIEVENQGTAAAGATEMRLYLSDGCGLSGTNISIGTASISALAPGGVFGAQINWTIPENFKPGAYQFLVVADHNNLIAETNEGNNTMCKSFGVALSAQSINNNFERSTQVLSSYHLRYPSYERRNYSSPSCPAINNYYIGGSVKKNWIPSVSSCNLTYQDGIMLAAFKLPNGKTIADVNKITLKLTGTTSNVSSGASFTLFEIHAQQADVAGPAATQFSGGQAMAKLYSTTGVIGRNGAINESKRIPTNVFNPTSGHLHFMVRAIASGVDYSFSNVSLEVEFTVPVTPGCSATDWWRENLTSAGANIVKDQMFTNRHKDIVFRTVNYKVGVAIKKPFGDYDFFEIGSNLNYMVASNVVSNSNDEVFFRSPTNDLMRLYWDASAGSWAVSNMNNVAAGGCGGHLAIHNDKVFYRTTNNLINAVYYNGTTWVRDQLNNVPTYGCAGHLAINNSGQVFYRDYNQRMNGIYLDAGTWRHTPLNYTGTDCIGFLAINSSNDVFYRGAGGVIHLLYWNGTGWAKDDYVGFGAQGSLSIGTDNKVFYTRKDFGWATPRIRYIEWDGMNWAQRWTTNAKDAAMSDLTTGNVVATGFQNEVFYVQNGGNMARLYYGNAVGCDPTRKTDLENFEEETDGLQLQTNADFGTTTVYPNPSSGIFNLMFEDAGQRDYRVYDVAGKLVTQSQVSDMNATIDLSGFNRGVYFLHLEHAGRQERIRLIKH